MPITRPVNLQVPFANSGSKNTIPVASQIGIVAGAASFTDGFPPLTTTPIAAGGVPPAGADFNGILNILSQHTTFQNGGGKYRFDVALSTAIGGYPVGFVLQDDAGLNSYVNILAANTTNFNSSPASIGVSWIPYAGQAATQSGLNVSATAAGTADALTAAFSPAVLALINGMALSVRSSSANATTTPTFSPNGLTAKNIVKGNGLPLAAGDIAGAGHWIDLQYDLTLDKWVLLNPATGVVSQQAGEVCYFARNTAPFGFLKANGAAISRTTYSALFAAIGTVFGVGDGSTTFNIPDLRGEFIRSWDDARGIDTGRSFASFQGHGLQDHQHNIQVASGAGSSTTAISRGNAETTGVFMQNNGAVVNATTATETRPRNVALLACIKY